MNQKTGTIAQIQGNVVDVDFSEGNIPQIYEALVVQGDNGQISGPMRGHGFY